MALKRSVGSVSQRAAACAGQSQRSKPSSPTRTTCSRPTQVGCSLSLSSHSSGGDLRGRCGVDKVRVLLSLLTWRMEWVPDGVGFGDFAPRREPVVWALFS